MPTQEGDSVADSSAVRDDARDEAPRRTSPALFLRQVVAELRKVNWPTREQVTTYFLVVMVFVLFMMLLVSLLDLGFGRLIFQVFAPNGT
jgi:preprotein translocase subunit SecE